MPRHPLRRDGDRLSSCPAASLSPGLLTRVSAPAPSGKDEGGSGTDHALPEGTPSSPPSLPPPLPITGSLPASWAEAGAFESLSFMQLQNNNLAGTIPSKFWSGSAFNTDTGSSLYVRPGNQLLCGSVTTVLAGNTTLLQLMALDLFTPGAVTTITNTLGPCLRACTAADAGAAEITTNVFDLAQEYNVSLTDVIALNPGLKNLPGVAVTLPCYQTPYRGDTLIGGSDAGYGQVRCQGGEKEEREEGGLRVGWGSHGPWRVVWTRARWVAGLAGAPGNHPCGAGNWQAGPH